MSNPPSSGEIKNSPNYEIYHKYHELAFGDNGFLIGQLLTLADASFADPEQRKAFKDLVKDRLSEHFIEAVRPMVISIAREFTAKTDDPLFQNEAWIADKTIKKSSSKR